MFLANDSADVASSRRFLASSSSKVGMSEVVVDVFSGVAVEGRDGERSLKDSSSRSHFRFFVSIA